MTKSESERMGTCDWTPLPHKRNQPPISGPPVVCRNWRPLEPVPPRTREEIARDYYVKSGRANSVPSQATLDRIDAAEPVSPSVQPPIKRRVLLCEIERHDCGIEGHSPGCHCMCVGKLAAEPPSVPSVEPKWISAEERLPELEDHMGVKESAILLFRHDQGTPHLGYMSKGNQWFDYWSNRQYTATLWMEGPPDPPKGEV